MGLKWIANRWGLDAAGDIEPAANNTYALSTANFWTRASIVTLYTYIVRLFGTSFTADLVANSAATANQTLTLPAGTTDTLVSWAGTETLSQKRINPRVTSATSASSLTPDVSVADMYVYTALAAGLTINAPTGTPVGGNRLRFRFRDNGTGRALTFNATFRALGVTIPTTTTANKTLYVDTVYNNAETVWDVIDVKVQA